MGGPQPESLAVREFVRANRGRSTCLGYGCYASHRHRYVYLSLGKVVSTKIKADLHRLEGYELPANPGQVHDRTEEGQDFVPSLIDFTEDEAVEALMSPQWLRFCFVRNPYYRLFSAYKSKILNWKDEQYMPFQQEIREHFDYPVRDGRPAGMVSFRDFVTYLEGQAREQWDGHWNLQSRALYPDQIDYDCTGCVENFGSDFAEILRRLGAPPAASSLDERFNPTVKIYHAAVYDAELAGRVYEKYRADFERYGYDRDSWLFDF